MPRSKVSVFTSSGTWTKDPKLYAIEIVGRGPGGGGSWPTGNGNGYGGGGGGVSRTDRRIQARELPDTVDVVVGAPGMGGNATSRNGTSGGVASFGKFLRVEGGGGATTSSAGVGGLGIYRGGNGGNPGSPGGSTPRRPSDYLCGPGGGAGGGGFPGGSSGSVLPGTSFPILWQTTQSGGGGSSGTVGGSPGGGGGGGQAPSLPAGNGGVGCITVIEYLYDEE